MCTIYKRTQIIEFFFPEKKDFEYSYARRINCSSVGLIVPAFKIKKYVLFSEMNVFEYSYARRINCSSVG